MRYNQASLKFLENDVFMAIKSWRLWLQWAVRDTGQRYQRSVIGPLWVSLSLAIWIVGIGGVFSVLFQMPIKELLPYVCSGMILWRMIFSTIIDGCAVFADNDRFIKQLRVPLFVYVLRVVSRSFINFFHHLLVFVIVFLIFPVPITWYTLLAIPGLLLLILNSVWVVALFGLIATRFRDVPHIIEAGMQLMFFITPVFWRPEQFGEHGRIVIINPFYHYIEIVRAPLLGSAPPYYSWIIVAVIGLAGLAVTLHVYGKFSRRIAYWL